MKRLLLLLLLASGLPAQEPAASVTVTVAVAGGSTYTLQASPAALAALSQYLISANASKASPLALICTSRSATIIGPPYADVGDMLIKHGQMLLGLMVIQNPPAAVVTAQTAATAAQAVVQAAISNVTTGTVTVQQTQ
jgi:hypothetical protein